MKTLGGNMKTMGGNMKTMGGNMKTKGKKFTLNSIYFYEKKITHLQR